MGATYTRQSSSDITDGAVIEASHLNSEFDQLLAAFAVSTGHSHDGTAAEGGPITKLLGTAITIGDATAGTDIAITFDGESNDGVLTWMEDEDYFQFSDDLLLSSTEKIQFRDTAIYINSSTDGQLDLVADTEIQIAATTIDINGAVALNGAITGATNITLSGELDAATLDISGDADIDGTLETDALSINGTAVTSTAAELNLVDGITAGTVSASLAVIADSNKDISGFRNVTLTGELDAATLDISGNADIDGTLETDALSIDGTTITSTAAEINILDGDNSASTVTIADADRIILNDGGTMKQVAVSALNTYTSSSIAADDIGTGDAAVTLATSSGNITIDATANNSDIIFKGTDATSDITMLTLDGSEAGAATFNNKVVATELDISGDVDIDGTLEADAITINGTGIGSIYQVLAGSSDIVTTGALNSGSITSGFGTIDTGSSAITTTGLISGGSLDIDNVLINGTTIGHTDDTDLMTVADGLLTVAGEVSMTTLDIGGTNVTTTAAELNLIDGGTARGTDALADGDGILINDGGTMKMTNVTAVKTYMAGSAASQGFAIAMSVAL